MRGFFSGLFWILVALVVCPLAALLRADARTRTDLEPLGYDDNDPGTDVDHPYQPIGDQ